MFWGSILAPVTLFKLFPWKLVKGMAHSVNKQVFGWSRVFKPFTAKYHDSIRKIYLLKMFLGNSFFHIFPSLHSERLTTIWGLVISTTKGVKVYFRSKHFGSHSSFFWMEFVSFYQLLNGKVAGAFFFHTSRVFRGFFLEFFCISYPFFCLFVDGYYLLFFFFFFFFFFFLQPALWTVLISSRMRI